MKRLRGQFALVALLITLLACNLFRLAGKPGAGDAGGPVASFSPTAGALPGLTDIPTSTPTVTLSPTPTLTPTLSPTPTATPYGCLRPPDNYERVLVNDEFWLNKRTLWMLEHAQTLYEGTHDFVQAITQGSYHPGLDASFGTHDGGGAVDLSVRDQSDWHVLYDEFNALVLALRRAGFAAWIRDVGELYDLSPIHIHAIAIGDAELSEAAQLQLTGPAGYFRGFNGLPEDPPLPDAWGEPLICPWMLEMGYEDLRGEAP